MLEEFVVHVAPSGSRLEGGEVRFRIVGYIGHEAEIDLHAVFDVVGAGPDCVAARADGGESGGVGEDFEDAGYVVGCAGLDDACGVEGGVGGPEGGLAGGVGGGGGGVRW